MQAFRCTVIGKRRTTAGTRVSFDRIQYKHQLSDSLRKTVPGAQKSAALSALLLYNFPDFLSTVFYSFAVIFPKSL